MDLSKPPSECILFVINQRREMGAGTYPEAKQAKELAARYHSCARPPLFVTTNLDAQRTAIWDMGKIAVSGDGAIFCSCSFARGGRGHSGGQLRP